MSLLSLPTELLDHIFGYLDWDNRSDLCPEKGDIIRSSVTCRQLRKVLVPLVFRDCVLKLCWAGGLLIEPALLKLRKQCPDLTKHIRCVYIRADFDYRAIPHGSSAWVPYRTPPPGDIQDWLDPSSQASEEPKQQMAAFRDHVNVAARMIAETFTKSAGLDNPNDMSAEQIVEASLSRAGEQGFEKLLALSIVMLCIPSTTETLIFKALADGDDTDTKSRFGLSVAATAIALFKDRLLSITMITNDALRSHGPSWRHQQREAMEGIYGTRFISAQSLANLNLRRLALASGDGPRNSAIWRYQGFERWQSVSQSVKELDLRYIKANPAELLSFIQSFSVLELLNMKHIALTMPWTRGAVITNRDSLRRRIWLRFLIDLRQTLLHVRIEVSGPIRDSLRDPALSISEVKWLLQAVPAGSLIDADREERLIQDHISFSQLWEAEDSERGSLAMEEWAQKRAELSDAAMSTRWR